MGFDFFGGGSEWERGGGRVERVDSEGEGMMGRAFSSLSILSIT